MTKFWENKFKVALSATLLILMVGCVDADDRMGNDSFIPNGGDYQMFIDTFIGLDIETKKIDSVAIDNIYEVDANYNSIYHVYLGSQVTPEEGLIQSSFVATLNPSAPPYVDNEDAPFGREPIIDSAFIGVTVSSYAVSNGIKESSIYVYDLKKNLPFGIDSTYYSNFKIKDYIAEKPYAEGVLNIGSHILLPLDKELAKQFISLKASQYTNVDEYRKIIKGLYFKTSSVNEGTSVSRIDPTTSGVVIYYRNRNEKPDTSVYYSSMENIYSDYYGYTYIKGKVFNIIERNFDLRDPVRGVKLTNTDENKQYGYASGMGGLKTKVTFRDELINKIKASMAKNGATKDSKILVVNATMAIPVATESLFSLDRALTNIGAYKTFGKTYLIPDYTSKTSSRFGGALNRSKMVYEINISTFVQSVVNGTIDYKSFEIAPGFSNYYDANVASFENSTEKPITLKVTYSLIK